MTDINGKFQSDTECVLYHLQNVGGISSMEAFYKYGITRLSACIYRLRKKGYEIKSTQKKTVKKSTGNIAVYDVYSLKGSISDELCRN